MIKKRIEQFQDQLARLFVNYQDLASKNKDNTLARTVTFQVTDACNLSCSYCYQGNKSNHTMSFGVAKRFIDMILQGDNEYINKDISPGIIIEFIGGEPFLEINLIDQITDYFIEQMIIQQHPWATRFMLSICSNGVNYFDEKVQAYIKKHLHHLSFSISIDGNKELHDSCRVFPDGSGSYDIAIAGVNHFTKVLGGKMGSKMTLAPENVSHTFVAVKNLIELGYTEINMNCVYEEGWTLEHANILYDQLCELGDYVLDNDLTESHYIAMFEEQFFKPKDENDLDNWCGGTGKMISVDYKGDIFPCIRYMESSLGEDVEPIIIGNVFDGLMSNEKQCEHVNCLNCVNRKTQSTEKCFHCPIAEGCSWCSALNYQITGTPDKRVTYICDMHIARALANVRFWNKYFKSINSETKFINHVPDDWAIPIIGEDELNKLKEDY